MAVLGLGLIHFAIRRLHDLSGRARQSAAPKPKNGWGLAVGVACILAFLALRGIVGIPWLFAALLTPFAIVGAALLILALFYLYRLVLTTVFVRKADPALRRLLDAVRAEFMPKSPAILAVDGYWERASTRPKVRIELRSDAERGDFAIDELIAAIAARIGDAIRADAAFAPYGATYDERSAVWATVRPELESRAARESPSAPSPDRSAAPDSQSRTYPFDIPGIAGDSPRSILFDSRMSKETVERLIDEIPVGTVVAFYDRGYPSSSDPGAWISFRRAGSGYRYKCSNHGWTTRWKRIGRAELTTYLTRCAWHNRGSVSRFSEAMFCYSSPARTGWWP